LKKANEKGYGIIARMPLQFGLLTGKFNAESRFPDNDHRRSRLTKEVILKTTKALEPVWELCNKCRITKAQLALSYVLSHREISTIIPGIRTPEHVEQNTNGLIRLDDEDLKMIESLGQTDFVSVLDLIKQQG
jgi:aryl-alcohol dehydrogenase-like predicted oxidoreductase